MRISADKVGYEKLDVWIERLRVFTGNWSWFTPVIALIGAPATGSVFVCGDRQAIARIKRLIRTNAQAAKLDHLHNLLDEPILVRE